jgi:hypothetical protein
MTALADALRAPGIIWGDFVELLTDTPIRAWSGFGNVTLESKTWQGIAVAGAVTSVRMTPSTEINGFQIGLHIPATGNQTDYSAFVTQMLLDKDLDVSGKRVNVYVGIFAADGSLVGGSLWWRCGGYASHITANVLPGAATLSLHVEPSIGGAAAQSAVFLANIDQLRRHPGDKFLEFQAGVSRGVTGRWDPVT